ncbi:camp-regulated phospho protein family protein Igo1 [Zopfia rhizophila CBS 207.26]|uniref:mRNA stability protein n=1 Tax=Zopfia rhizophila CBS 207.26 TaxID=1314779 RepID=A0A6A6DGS7_9PEZI|nr:camp-regulated phospho protein family protein Igo1 [Zopfia rhizophila CBS 207.26]
MRSKLLISRKSLTEQDSRLLHQYGKLPARGDLIHHQLERRKYFDSGDFALSQAHRASDIGHIRTGTEHPLRESISHPSSPVPGGSNIKDGSNKQEKGVEERYKAKEASNLHQQMSTDRSESTQ